MPAMLCDEMEMENKTSKLWRAQSCVAEQVGAWMTFLPSSALPRPHQRALWKSGEIIEWHSRTREALKMTDSHGYGNGLLNGNLWSRLNIFSDRLTLPPPCS